MVTVMLCPVAQINRSLFILPFIGSGNQERECVIRMKRCFCLLIAVILIFGLAACEQPQTTTQPQVPTTSQVEKTAVMLLQRSAEPVFGSVGGEWMALGLARWEGVVPQSWFDRYYEAVVQQVKDCDGILSERKYTVYSRVILALTAIGKDPTDVGGYNLLVPLADYDKTLLQGINGPIFALLALDSGNYEIPEIGSQSTQATREAYIDYLLEQQLPGGGWTMFGDTAEADITAMALQALAGYRQQEAVSEAVEKGLKVLSDTQNQAGGYTAYQADSCETVAQVIVALTALGISVDDPRFVKNGNTLEDRLLDFVAEDNGFRHLLDGKTDPIATEQAFYALVALWRAQLGKTPLYDMSDVR